MKKIISIFMIIFTIATLGGCGSKKQDQSKTGNSIKEKGKLIVGLDDSFPPMGFRDEKGEIVGFDIDLAKEVAKRMDVEVEFKPVDWDGIVLSLNNKDIDVIWNGLTITEDRKKKIGFSKPYLKNRQVVVVNKDSSINKKSELQGKIIGVQMGSSSEEALNNDKIVDKIEKVKKYSNNVEALMDLKAGRIEAVVIDEVVGRYYDKKNENVYKVLEEDLGSEEYGVGYRKDDKVFGEELDKVMDEMKKDGTADKISEKWFNKGIVEK